MTPLTQEIIKDLVLQNSGTLKVSIYVKIYPFGEETKKNVIRLKNQLTEVEGSISTMNLEDGFKKNWESAKSLIDTLDFGKEKYNGLAIFISEKTFSYFKLSNEVEDFNSIDSHFYIKPLFENVDSVGEYYVLDVSQNYNRVLKCNKYGFEEIKIKTQNWPESIEDLPTLQKRSESLQSHASGSGETQIHGHAKWKDKQNDDVRDYFRMIDDELKQVLKEPVKLILATTKENFAIYKEQSRLNHVLNEFIEGNHKSLASKELFEKASAIANEIHGNEVNDLLEKIIDTGPKASKTSLDLAEIITKSFQGGVEQLIIDDTAQIFGKFDKETMEVEIHEEKEGADIELLNFAASQTVANGGRVELVKKEKLPEDVYAAALFRY